MKTPAAVIVSPEAVADDESKPRPVVAAAKVESESFTESDTDETKLHYGLGTFAWPVRIIWFGFACLSIYYVASFYVPSLRAWLAWTPAR